MTDELENITGVAQGRNAFQSCPPAGTPDRRMSSLATKHEISVARRSGQQSELIDDLRTAGVQVGVLRGLSQKSDELVRQSRERAITKHKPLSGFNVPIATAAESRRTRAIGGRLS